MPASSRILATATPAAPAPEMTTRVDSGLRPVSRSALVSAASATTAVPCWSSWKTGMSSRSLSRSSISKQRGRRDVLEVDAAEARRQPDDGLDDLLDVGGVQADRYGVDAAELLEQHRLALHHRHRRGRADVAETEHRGAVGDDRRPCWAPTCSAGSATGPRRSPRTPGRRPGCRPGRARRGRSRATVETISILPPTCRSKTGSPACGCADADGSGVRQPRGSILPHRATRSRPSSAEAGHRRRAAAARPGPARRPARRRRRPAPRCRESTPSAGLSLSSHQPVARAARPRASPPPCRRRTGRPRRRPARRRRR